MRTGSSRHAVVGVLVFLGGLLFFEKAAVIPFVAFAVVALLGYVTGPSPARCLATRPSAVGRVSGALGGLDRGLPSSSTRSGGASIWG